MGEDVVLELHGTKISCHLVKALLLVDNQEHRVVLVKAIIFERARYTGGPGISLLVSERSGQPIYAPSTTKESTESATRAVVMITCMVCWNIGG